MECRNQVDPVAAWQRRPVACFLHEIALSHADVVGVDFLHVFPDNMTNTNAPALSYHTCTLFSQITIAI